MMSHMTCHDQFCGCWSSRGTVRGCLGRSFKDLWLFEALEHIFWKINWRMSWEWRAVQLQFRSPDEQWAVAFWHRHAYTWCRHDGTVSTSQSQMRSFVKTSTATSCQRWCQNLDSWSIAGWFLLCRRSRGRPSTHEVKVTDMVKDGVAMTIMLQMKDEGWSNGQLYCYGKRGFSHNDAEVLLGMSPRSARDDNLPPWRTISEELSSFSCLDWPGKSGK